MNNSALKLFHELMKKGWIDRNDNSMMDFRVDCWT